MKKKFKNVLVATLSLLLCLQLTAPAFLTKALVPTGEIITVDPSVRHQTMEGWGTTIGWWGNIVGGWTQPGESGKPLRDEINELLFSDAGIGLNIIRYNIGGGDDPSHSHMSRLEGNMQGFKTSSAAPYDWTRDANQIYCMEQAIALRGSARAAQGLQNDIITEFFSNSPPYWLTQSGCSTGANSASSNNISNANMPAFAQYLGDVTRYFAETKGITADYLVPLNEAASNYWSRNSVKQEGCKISAGSSQNALYNAMRDQTLPAGTTLSGLDETDVSTALSSWNNSSFSAANKAAFSKYSTHTYGATFRDRITLRDTMASAEKKLWMSEVCQSSTYNSEGWNPNSMATPMTLSNGILADLKDMKVSAWVFWQAVENLMECTKYDGNWGLITAAYYEPFGTPGSHWQQTDTGNNFSKYGLSWNGTGAGDVDVGDYWIGKSYYMLGQYSKFIKQGYTLVEIGDGAELAAISPDGKELVIVATNDSTAVKEKTYFLNGAENLSHVEAYRTSDSENLARLADIPVFDGGYFNATLPPRSVSTFVVKADAKLYSGATSHLVNNGVTGGNDNFAFSSGSNRNWSTNNSQSGAYSTDVRYTNGSQATVTLNFVGTRAQICGSLASDAGQWNVSVDGNAKDSAVSGKVTGSRVERQVLADSGELAYGAHSLTISNISTGYCTVDYGKIYETSLAASADKTALNARIAEVQDTAKGYYTDASWDAFQGALSAAQSVSANAGATQPQVDSALGTLNSAFAGLTLNPVDKSALNTRIAAVQGTAKGYYTDASWDAFQGALGTAQSVSANAGATQPQVDSALGSLNSAFAGLTLKPVDKNTLNARIAEVQDTAKGFYTDASWDTFQGALATAKSISTNAEATQPQVDNALGSLNSAFAGLTLKPVDKSALNTRIAEVQGTAKGYYTDASWDTFQGALGTAQSVSANAGATQPQVDSALAALNSAFAGLTLKPVEPTVNKAALNARIQAVKNTAKGDFTDASWDAFQNALNTAQSISGDTEASQALVDEALGSLNSAFAGLTHHGSSTCGCCDKHNHSKSFWDSIACFFCKIAQFFRRLFGLV